MPAIASKSSAHQTANTVHLGQDVLLEISKYMNPIEYSAVSRLFWRVAEERAEELLKGTEDRCFGRSYSDWSSLVGKAKWKFRMGLSIVEGYRGVQKESANNKNVLSRKRKRCTIADGEDRVLEFSSSSSEVIDRAHLIEESTTTRGSLTFPKPAINLMASRLLWNQAFRVPLSSTMVSFNGPSAMLPNGHHMAFFCPTYLHIIVVDVEDNGSIVDAMSVKEMIPVVANTAVAADLRLVCSDDGHLMLYCNHHSHDPLLEDEELTKHQEIALPSLDTPPPPKQTRPLDIPRDTLSWDEEGCTAEDDFSAIYITPQNNNNVSCWVSVWKINPNNSREDTNNAATTILKHKYFRSLDALDLSDDSSQAQANNTDEESLPPIQETTASRSSGTLLLLRYTNYHYNEDDDFIGSNGDDPQQQCWIESLDISSGARLATKKIQLTNDGGGYIWNSQLSVPQDGNHVLATFYHSTSSSMEATKNKIYHVTLDKASLEIVDVFETPQSDTNVDTMNVFVQHAGRKILHYSSQRRCFPCDPKIVYLSSLGTSSTTNGQFSLSVNSAGKFFVQQHQQYHPQRKVLPKYEQPPAVVLLNPNPKPQNRWRIVPNIWIGKNNNNNNNSNNSTNYGFFENPDDDKEELLLDQVHLETGKTIRSISTGFSRLAYSVESIHSVAENASKNGGGDAYVVLSGVVNSDFGSTNCEGSNSNNICSSSTVILRILSNA